VKVWAINFLTNIRETDAIAQVVRIFEDENIIHVDGKINPLKDIEVINLELILADLQTVTKRLANLGREVKKGDKVAVIEHGLLERIEKALQAGQLASTVIPTEPEMSALKQIHLLTSKPMLYVLNKKAQPSPKATASETASNLDILNDDRWKQLTDFFEKTHAKYVIVDARIEEELKDFEGQEKEEFRKELAGDIKEDGVNDLIRAGHDLLGLITYFTTGEDETRAWTIVKGWTAPLAGTAIHTDFKDKFVRAEVIEWDKLLVAGSYGAAREKGLVRTEGKEYIVKDGDVIEFKI
jgi:GTP-binding protein YchF